MLHARPDELRLALLALVSAAGTRPEARWLCSDVMDEATLAARIAPPFALETVEALDATSARLGAVRVLTSLCFSCGACPRGR